MHFTFWFEVSKSLLPWEKQFLWLLHEIQITWNGISIASKFLALKSKPALLSEVIFFLFYIWSHLFLLSMVLINGRWRKNVCRTDYKTVNISWRSPCTYDSPHKWIFDYSYSFMQIMICDISKDQKSFSIFSLQHRSNLLWKTSQVWC